MIVDPQVRAVEFLLRLKAHGMVSNWHRLVSPQRPPVLSQIAQTRGGNNGR